MAETINSISQVSITKTVSLTTDVQPLFSQSIQNGSVSINMTDGAVNIGTIDFVVGGDLCKTDVATGGMYFDQNVDNTRLPIAYSASDGVKNYTVKFSYNNNTKKIEVCKEVNDPDVSIVFTGIYKSATENLSGSTYSINTIKETATNVGTTFENSINLNGGVEMSNLPSDTITFNDTSNIAYTNVSSKATRVGKLCVITIKANLTISGGMVNAKSVNTFFSITPTGKYANPHVSAGIVTDISTHDIGTVYNDANTSDFYVTLPRTLNNGTTSTVVATITYVI